MRTLSLLVFLAACATTTTPATPDAEAETKTEATGEEAGGETTEAAGTAEADAEAHDSDAGTEEAAAGMADMEKVAKAQSEVHAMMPRKDAMAKLEGLGDPASSSDTEMTWMTKDGDACKQLKVTFMGDMVGAATLEDADCPSGE